MATVPTSQPDVTEASTNAEPRKSRRRKTSHLKNVPETKELRLALRDECRHVATQLEKSRPLSKDEMETICREILTRLNLPEGNLGWLMVILASEFWRDQVAATSPDRRLFLLPHCLKHAEGCPADYDEFGLDCEQCGACSIADFRTTAEKMGYRVLVAEGSPIILKIIVSGYVDAIVGVACLNVLEKAIDKILLAGIPCMAVPLLSSDCRNTSVDEDWVNEIIHVRHEEPVEATRSYVHLMRAANSLFGADELERLIPRKRSGPRLAENELPDSHSLDPIAATEAISYDFLATGGKHSRPFITLAVHDALTGAAGTLRNGSQHLDNLQDGVRAIALSIETFHKASLVHDDIEDDDSFRYGDETIHRKYGIPTAINVGDYLIGMGYRLISRESPRLGADVSSDILDYLADAHMRLAEGQGAELMWRDSHNKQLTPLDSLKIYALKTAPAFEAALLAGARLAGSVETLREPIAQFARHLGIAFQILNDLLDWRGDHDNKRTAATDVLGGRPTLLWALALDHLDEAGNQELLDLIQSENLSVADRISRVHYIYLESNVFQKADRMVDKYQGRAEAIADDIQSDELRRLFYYLVDTVLERPAETEPALLLPTDISLAGTSPIGDAPTS